MPSSPEDLLHCSDAAVQGYKRSDHITFQPDVCLYGSGLLLICGLLYSRAFVEIEDRDVTCDSPLYL
jgi:hypothetical protein